MDLPAGRRVEEEVTRTQGGTAHGDAGGRPQGGVPRYHHAGTGMTSEVGPEQSNPKPDLPANR